MKVTVEAAALAAAIKRSAAERRSTTLPILAHVALDAEGGLHFGKTREAAAARVEIQRKPIELLVI